MDYNFLSDNSRLNQKLQVILDRTQIDRRQGQGRAQGLDQVRRSLEKNHLPDEGQAGLEEEDQAGLGGRDSGQAP